MAFTGIGKAPRRVGLIRRQLVREAPIMIRDTIAENETVGPNHRETAALKEGFPAGFRDDTIPCDMISLS
jgi:hypothetical protein